MLSRKISLENLRIFEVAARLRSFTAAGNELGLTQGAVSQRVKSLETALGLVLFRRLTRAIDLTPEGERLYQSVRSGLRQIADGIEAIQKADPLTPIRLATPASVAACWLMPRLETLDELRPPLAVSVLASDRLQEIGIEADIGLRFGRGLYPGMTTRKIGSEFVYPVCSPAYLAAHPQAAEIGRLPPEEAWKGLTRIESDFGEGSGCSWQDWSTHFGREWPDNGPRSRYSHHFLAIKAAEQGMGIAIARGLLVHDLVQSGTLIRLAPELPPLAAHFHYYVVTAGEPSPRLRRLIAWLKEQFAAMTM